MNIEREILETWIGTLADSHSQMSASLLAPKPDPFRNPVGYAIRTSMGELWKQLKGDMDPQAVDSALDVVLRIRAVQDLSVTEAVGFVVRLRPILRQLSATSEFASFDERIDQLALAAFDKYVQCRDQLRAARLHEIGRLTRPHRSRGRVGV
ncbi:dissimilatory sulfite reductase system component, protein DsrT [Candidatus Sulfotelmatobacter kueseliae]|uniref:Dissimilatory sulfite reductase system component, protein DsrT n=1 Tax=Candidatus Sulfotelmatobacter kueseliae TaxID=2042962 RepID=A0A2U3JY65_9BACT|nr:dissimilatory sulfite reductase system component, protein DsrT [Candidatus Sulfotelmatobacter kueseliae]